MLNNKRKCVIHEITSYKHLKQHTFFHFTTAKSAIKKEQSFISYKWNALINHVIYEELTSSAIHCAFLCMNNPTCKSINYKSQHADGEGECQLNDATAEEFPLDIIHSSHSTYTVPIV